jgi:hypothetical protein
MNTQTAKDKLTEATRDVTEATRNVDDAREAVSLGEASARHTYKAQRALDRALEREAQARADLKVAERREQAEAEAAKAEADRIRRELNKILRQRANTEAEKYREFLEATRAALSGYQQRLAGFEDQLGYRSLVTPARFESFALMDSALADQLAHFTRPTGTQEANQ